MCSDRAPADRETTVPVWFDGASPQPASCNAGRRHLSPESRWRVLRDKTAVCVCDAWHTYPEGGPAIVGPARQPKRRRNRAGPERREKNNPQCHMYGQSSRDERSGWCALRARDFRPPTRPACTAATCRTAIATLTLRRSSHRSARGRGARRTTRRSRALR